MTTNGDGSDVAGDGVGPPEDGVPGDGAPQKDNRNTIIIVLAVALTVIVGGIIGFLVASRGGDGAASSTTLVPPTAASTAPLTPTSAFAPETTVASTAPVISTVPGQMIIPALEDTYTDAGEPDEVNGTEPILEIENEPPEIKLGLVRFEVPALPEGEAVQQAILQFTTVTAGSQVNVHLVDGDWNEAETNAGNAPVIGERVGEILPAGADGPLVELDVTAIVTEPGRYDFYLTTTGDNTTEYAAKEAGVGAPTLVVHHG